MVSLALEESNRAHSEQLLRESEARSRESEERFSTAFRLVPLNITILRLRDAKFVEANDAFVRWLGLGRRELSAATPRSCRHEKDFSQEA